MGSSERGVQLLGGAQTAATTAPHWKEAVEVVACWMRQVKCLELLFYHFIKIVVMNCRTVCIICNVQQCATQRFFNVNLPYFKNMWTSIVVLIFSYLTSFLFKCFSSPLSVWSLTLIVHNARCRAATAWFVTEERNKSPGTLPVLFWNLFYLLICSCSTCLSSHTRSQCSCLALEPPLLFFFCVLGLCWTFLV